jgi:hypothetical protein
MSPLKQLLKAQLCAVVAILLLWTTPHVVAADDLFDYMLPPAVSRHDFAKMLPQLGLSSEEEMVVRGLFESYDAGVLTEVAELHAYGKRLEAGEAGSWDARNWNWLEGLLKLQARLESDVKAALNDEAKLKRWEKAIAGARRRTTLSYLRKIERVRHACDLRELLDPIPLTAAELTNVSETIDTYEAQMDTALRELENNRVPIMKTICANRNSHPGGETGDPEKYKTLMDAIERYQKLVQRIPQVTEASAAEIAAALDEHRDAFIEAHDRCDYPDAFETCPAELALDAIRLVEEVHPDKHEALEATFLAYQPVRDQLNRQIASVVRRWETEDNQLKRDIVALQQRRERGEVADGDYYTLLDELEAQHPANPLLQRRHDLALETVRRMRSVFTDDELQKLPLAARLCLSVGQL